MKIGTVYDITFSTNKADTGALSNADSTPIVRITENGANLAYSPTVNSLTTGVYITTIDASLANGFEVGKRYSVYVTATVNGVEGANGLDSFTLETRSIDDVLPTASYTTAPSVAQIRTELSPELVLIDLNLDAKVSEAGGGSGGASVADIWTAQISDYSGTPGSFANKFEQYGGVSHVIDRSSLDDVSKAELKSFKEKMEEFNKTLKEFKSNEKDFDKIVEAIKNNPSKTTIVNKDSKYEETIGELLVESLPQLIEKLDSATEIIPLYEELINYMEAREKDWEQLVEDIINNK